MRCQPYSGLLGSYGESCSPLWKQFRSWPALYVDKILFSGSISNRVRRSSWPWTKWWEPLSLSISQCAAHHLAALWCRGFWEGSGMHHGWSKLWELELGSGCANMWGEMQQESSLPGVLSTAVFNSFRLNRWSMAGFSFSYQWLTSFVQWSLSSVLGGSNVTFEFKLLEANLLTQYTACQW